MSVVRDVDFRGGRPHTPNQHDDRSHGGGPGGGNGGDGGMIDSKVAKLESDVEYIKRDVAEIKTSLGKVVSDVGDIKVTLAEMKAKQETFSTKEQLAEIATKQDGFATKIQLSEITAKLDSFSTKEQLQQVKTDLATQMHSQTKWLIASVFVIVAGVATVNRLFPAPVLEPAPSHAQLPGGAAVNEPAPTLEAKKK